MTQINHGANRKVYTLRTLSIIEETVLPEMNKPKSNKIKLHKNSVKRTGSPDQNLETLSTRRLKAYLQINK